MRQSRDARRAAPVAAGVLCVDDGDMPDRTGEIAGTDAGADAADPEAGPPPTLNVVTLGGRLYAEVVSIAVEVMLPVTVPVVDGTGVNTMTVVAAAGEDVAVVGAEVALDVAEARVAEDDVTGAVEEAKDEAAHAVDTGRAEAELPPEIATLMVNFGLRARCQDSHAKIYDARQTFGCRCRRRALGYSLPEEQPGVP
jgi:hypothetical protein